MNHTLVSGQLLPCIDVAVCMSHRLECGTKIEQAWDRFVMPKNHLNRMSVL